MLDKLTVKAQEALAAAQAAAGERGHATVSPLHLLDALLRQEGGLAGPLLEKVGVPAERVGVGGELGTLPPAQPVRPGRHGHGPFSPGRPEPRRGRGTARCLDEYISVEHLLLALAEEPSPARDILDTLGVDKAALLAAMKDIRGSQRVTDQNPEDKYQALERYGRDLCEMARQGKLDPVIGRDEEIRRVHAGALAPDEEQPRADRRAGRGQDGHRRGPGPADRQRRRAGGPGGQDGHRPGHGGAAGRGQVPRRVRGPPQGRHQGGHRQPTGGSSCSSTSCTPSSAPGRPRGRSPPATCSSRPWPAASCAASARPRWTSTASTSRRTPPWSGASSRCWSDEPSVEDTIAILRGLKDRYDAHHGVRIQDAALVAAAR